MRWIGTSRYDLRVVTPDGEDVGRSIPIGQRRAGKLRRPAGSRFVIETFRRNRQGRHFAEGSKTRGHHVARRLVALRIVYAA